MRVRVKDGKNDLMWRPYKKRERYIEKENAREWQRGDMKEKEKKDELREIMNRRLEEPYKTEKKGKLHIKRYDMKWKSK